jgi:hypothetical protein
MAQVRAIYAKLHHETFCKSYASKTLLRLLKNESRRVMQSKNWVGKLLGNYGAGSCRGMTGSEERCCGVKLVGGIRSILEGGVALHAQEEFVASVLDKSTLETALPVDEILLETPKLPGENGSAAILYGAR